MRKGEDIVMEVAAEESFIDKESRSSFTDKSSHDVEDLSVQSNSDQISAASRSTGSSVLRI